MFSDFWQCLLVHWLSSTDSQLQVTLKPCLQLAPFYFLSWLPYSVSLFSLLLLPFCFYCCLMPARNLCQLILCTLLWQRAESALLSVLLPVWTNQWFNHWESFRNGGTQPYNFLRCSKRKQINCKSRQCTTSILADQYLTLCRHLAKLHQRSSEILHCKIGILLFSRFSPYSADSYKYEMTKHVQKRNQPN